MYISVQNKQTPRSEEKSIKNKLCPSIESSTGTILSILCLGKTSVTAIMSGLDVETLYLNSFILFVRQSAFVRIPTFQRLNIDTHKKLVVGMD